MIMRTQGKHRQTLFALVLTLTLFAFTATATLAQNARVQIIHNAADPAAAAVDVYVNGTLMLDDFAFRTATPYLDLPAEVTLSMAVAPGTSTDVGDALATFDLLLEDGETYVVVASGVLEPSAFAPNPTGRPTGFTLWVKPGVRESLKNRGSVGYIIGHGVTDAPALDVRLRELGGRGAAARNAAYGHITNRSSIPARVYMVDLARAGTKAVVASFDADFDGLGGNTAVVLASGFVDRAANQHGAGLALIAALPDGTVVELPKQGSIATTARVQFIHNAAEPNLGIVDVFVDGALAFDDFAFRTATPFLDLPAGVPLAIDVAPFTTSDVTGSLATFTTTFEPGGTYVVIATGLLEPDQFGPNPDTLSTHLSLFIKENARAASTDPNAFQVFAGHGVTDAPTLDATIRDGAFLVVDAAYGDLGDYVGVPPGVYTLDLVSGRDNRTFAASFRLDVSTLAGGTGVVLASGFLHPAENKNRNPFGLIVVLPDGTVIPLPSLDPPAPPRPPRIQFIHNAADPALDVVDVYINGVLRWDDFSFRTATPFVAYPGNPSLRIAVAPATSASVAEALDTFVVPFFGGVSYVAVFEGVREPSAFARNPDTRPTRFGLNVKINAREVSTDASVVQFFVTHSVTDAPTIDVVARGGATLVDDVPYIDQTGYVGVPPGVYTLDVTPGSDNSTILASFTADLSGLAGRAVAVLASGFLDPAANQNGPAFGLLAALPDGTIVPFEATSEAAARRQTGLAVLGTYPNPFNPTTTLRFDLPNAAEVSVDVFDMLGRTVLHVPAQPMAAGPAQRIHIDGSSLASGLYLYRIKALIDGVLQVRTGRMTLVK